MPDTDLASLIAEARRHLDAIGGEPWRYTTKQFCVDNAKLFGVDNVAHLLVNDRVLAWQEAPSPVLEAAAAFRNAMPTLLSSLETLTAERDRLKKENAETEAENARLWSYCQIEEDGTDAVDRYHQLQEENRSLQAEVEKLKQKNEYLKQEIDMLNREKRRFLDNGNECQNVIASLRYEVERLKKGE